MNTFHRIATVVLVIVVLSFSTSALSNPKNSGMVPEQEHLEMLYPTVLVRVGKGSGSGTVIYSEQNEDREYESFILTNWHVIKNYVKLSKVWDSDQQEHVDTETRRPVNIDLWEYNNFSTAVGTIGRIAHIKAYDKSRDLALLQISDTEREMPYVATLYPEDKDDGPWIFQTVYAVGAGLGKPPFPTMGLLAGYGNDQDGNSLYLASSPIVFGNSGGSLYAYSPRGQYELIGVPSMVSATGWTIVTHMAWCRPISEIRIFLRNSGYGFILGDEPEVEEEAEDAG
jgi:S1-C subfamily serine protease